VHASHNGFACAVLTTVTGSPFSPRVVSIASGRTPIPACSASSPHVVQTTIGGTTRRANAGD
jgi:hypothetical protein